MGTADEEYDYLIKKILNHVKDNKALYAEIFQNKRPGEDSAIHDKNYLLEWAEDEAHFSDFDSIANVIKGIIGAFVDLFPSEYIESEGSMPRDLRMNARPGLTEFKNMLARIIPRATLYSPDGTTERPFDYTWDSSKEAAFIEFLKKNPLLVTHINEKMDYLNDFGNKFTLWWEDAHRKPARKVDENKPLYKSRKKPDNEKMSERIRLRNDIDAFNLDEIKKYIQSSPFYGEKEPKDKSSIEYEMYFHAKSRLENMEKDKSPKNKR